jgi:HSP20 family protein
MAQRTRSTQYALDIDRQFDALARQLLGWRLGSPSARESGNGEQAVAWVPTIEVFTRDKDLVVRAEIPGIDPDRDVNVFVENGMLVLSGERKQEQRAGDDRNFRTEIMYGSFLRTVPLPDGVNPEDVRATYDNGVLEIVVPKGAEAGKTKRVPIAATSSTDASSGGQGRQKTSGQARRERT